MNKIKNIGTCFLCKENVEHLAITKHTKKCVGKHSMADVYAENNKEKIFLVKIFFGKYFWLYVEINGSSTLETLDDFLRKTWLECCYHMSQFKINDVLYSSDEKMGKAIHRTLPVGSKFNYEYDFGSTTKLEGKVISTRYGELTTEIRLIARNNLPEVQCTQCKRAPEVICTACYDLFCKKCEKSHKSCGGEEYMLPVVNSPRMGVCGYTGTE